MLLCVLISQNRLSDRGASVPIILNRQTIYNINFKAAIEILLDCEVSIIPRTCAYDYK